MVQTFINGKIFTSNPEQPSASAMIVRDGRIVWIFIGAEYYQA